MICGEGVGRVLDDAAVRPRVEVDRPPDDVDLGVRQIPRRPTVIAGRLPSKKPGVADHADVGREALAVRLQPGVEVDRARLLLALEDELEVDRQAAAASPGAPRPPQTCDRGRWPLSSAAPRAEDPAVADDRLERRRLPQVERVDGLDVVVAVDEDGRGAGGVEPVGVDDRVAAGLGDLDVLEAGGAQLAGEPLGRAPAVGRVLRDRRRCWGCAGSRRSGARRRSAVVVEVRLEGGVGRSSRGASAAWVRGRCVSRIIVPGTAKGRVEPAPSAAWRPARPGAGQAGWAVGSAGASDELRHDAVERLLRRQVA